MSKPQKTKQQSRRKEEVIQLRVYDLSRGMAGPMSMPILGRQIDGVWHTGVHVFGSEYFYGGGINKMDPVEIERHFSLPVHSVLNLGTTTKTIEDFHAFLDTIKGSYTAEKYRLLAHNCNNFSEHVVRWLTDDTVGIPEHIRDLPNIVMSSPLARNMLLPMLENMHSNFQGAQPMVAADNRVRTNENESQQLMFGPDRLVQQYGKDLVGFFRVKAKQSKDKSVTCIRNKFLYMTNHLVRVDVKELQITHVLNMSNKKDLKEIAKIAEVFDMVPDESNMEEVLELTSNFIRDVHDKKGRCLVTADDDQYAGAAIVAYLLQYENASLEKELYEIRKLRRSFYPSVATLNALVGVNTAVKGKPGKLTPQAVVDLHLDAKESKLVKALLDDPVNKISELNLPGVSGESRIRWALQQAHGDVNGAVNLLIG